MKIHELLNDESKWCKDVLRKRDDEGNSIQWCLLGAFIECYKGHEYSLNMSKLHKRLTNQNINDWNDADTTKFEDVIKLVRELDI